MPLTQVQKIEIETSIREAILKKLENYNPETEAMPFHYRLLGTDDLGKPTLDW